MPSTLLTEGGCLGAGMAAGGGRASDSTLDLKDLPWHHSTKYGEGKSGLLGVRRRLLKAGF